MILSQPVALAALETPAASGALARALRVEERLRLHVDKAADSADLSPAWRELAEWVRQLLPPDKYQRFLQLVHLPLPTVKVTDRIFTALHRMFEAGNSRLDFEFQDPALAEDFDAYRERIGDEGYWPGRAFDAFKTTPHALVVVDLPADQGAAERPEPYYYLVPTKAVIDVRHRADGEGCEYAAFYTGANTAAVFDDAMWRTYQRTDDGKWLLTAEVAHGLGYCPARALTDRGAVMADPVSRVSPITTILGQLDAHVFWSASTDYARTYAAWPILWKFEEACDYRDEEDNECQVGFINYTAEYVDAAGHSAPQYRQKACPNCERNRLVGAGTVIEVPVPVAGSDTRTPVGMVSVDAAALTLAYSKLDAEREALFTAVAGATSEASATAINEKQVRQGVEDRREVLLGLASSMEGVHGWALNTVARLRYGALFVRGTVDYGDEFHLVSEAELVATITEQRKAGLPAYVVSSTRAQLLETAYRLAPDQRERASLLAQLEPYPDFGLAELQALATAVPGSVDPELLAVKLNFSFLVSRFERENGDLRRFASAGVSFERKVSTILTRFRDYVRESQSPRNIDPSNGGRPPAPDAGIPPSPSASAAAG